MTPSPDELRILDLVAVIARAEFAPRTCAAPRYALCLIAGALRELGYAPEATQALVSQGLEEGRAVYGPLDLATDKRDLRGEAVAELRDALVYLAAATITTGRGPGPGAGPHRETATVPAGPATGERGHCAPTAPGAPGPCGDSADPPLPVTLTARPA